MARLRIGEAVRRSRIGVTNFFRRRRRLPRYLMLSLSGIVDEIPPARPQFPFARFVLPADPPSVSSLRQVFDSIANDARIGGVVLRIECQASPAVYQSLRRLLLEFRAKGKRIVAYAHSFGPFQYYLACACDEIVMPPSAEWSVIGFLRETIFLKDALDQLGIGVDVVNVSPYKSAFDQFVRNDFSEESRAQAEWLLDAPFEEVVRGIAEGRKLGEAQVREQINMAPLSAAEARQHGLLDAVLYEDQLESHLAPAAPREPVAAGAAAPNEPKRRWWPFSSRSPIRQLGLYEDVARSLLIPYREYAPRHIGVVSVDGAIVEGRSQTMPLPIPLPFFGNRSAGSDSVAQALRRAAEDDGIAAVILYVNSTGGLVLASDLIAHEVRRLREKKPVVTYMSGVAASGGYYVSALANCIIAQPLTITGSIGVITFRPNFQQTDDKLYLHRVLLQRGERAGLYSTARPLSADEHAAIASSIRRAYDDFKQIVAEGRKLGIDEVESIAGGRVWTGAMAKERKLVDDLGDFTLAIAKAKELAGMPKDQRVRAISIAPPRKFVLPNPAAAASLIANGMTVRALLPWLQQARTLAIMPWWVEPGR